MSLLVNLLVFFSIVIMQVWIEVEKQREKKNATKAIEMAAQASKSIRLAKLQLERDDLGSNLLETQVQKLLLLRNLQRTCR